MYTRGTIYINNTQNKMNRSSIFILQSLICNLKLLISIQHIIFFIRVNLFNLCANLFVQFQISNFQLLFTTSSRFAWRKSTFSYPGEGRMSNSKLLIQM